MKIVKSIHKYNNGSYDEIWHREDDRYYWHREDGPAIIGYNSDGSIEHERYWINDQMHRLDGPAFIGYYNDGSIACEGYWINGVEYYYEDWKKHKLVREYRINRILENELDDENC